MNALQAHAHPLCQAARTLCLLDDRIAHLCDRLQLQFHDLRDVAKALHAPQGAGRAANPRAQRTRMELQGMLVMRFRLEQRLVDDHGPTITRQLLRTLNVRSLNP